jgi:hypothetical protein
MHLFRYLPGRYRLPPPATLPGAPGRRPMPPLPDGAPPVRGVREPPWRRRARHGELGSQATPDRRRPDHTHRRATAGRPLPRSPGSPRPRSDQRLGLQRHPPSEGEASGRCPQAASGADPVTKPSPRMLTRPERIQRTMHWSFMFSVSNSYESKITRQQTRHNDHKVLDRMKIPRIRPDPLNSAVSCDPQTANNRCS